MKGTAMSIFQTTLIPRRALWGGDALQKAFGLPPEFGRDVGQAWAFSAQTDHPSVLTGGEYTGRTLLDLWREKPGVFRSRFKDFPYIISLVAPMDDLSVQVHPGDDIARKMGLPHGKNEAWYFLFAAPDASIVYGHCASDEADLRRRIARGRWQELVKRLPVQSGDTVYIPAGMLHALCGGCLVYEIQQSTDITYRLYDYERTDAQGKPRPLQAESAIACLMYGDADEPARPASFTRRLPGFTETICLQNDSFTVRKIETDGRCTLRYDGYQLCTVARGTGFADDCALKPGDSFLLPAGEPLDMSGQMTLLTTSER